jgi:hypothetical protein
MRLHVDLNRLGGAKGHYATDAKDTKPTSYTLTGHEAEFGPLEGQRVEVVGTVAPALGDVRSGKMAGAADGAQRIPCRR